MSSQAVQAQIVECQAKIFELEDSIRQLQTLVETLKSELAAFIQEKTSFWDTFTQKKGRVHTIATIAGEMVIAKKYSEYQDAQFQEEHIFINKLEYVESTMRKEIEQDENKLSMNENELRNLKNRLGHLMDEYHDALGREAEEAARFA